MPYFLRLIRLPKWSQEDAEPYLSQGEFPADPLGDLATKKNELSVYLITDDRSNLARVTTALAANRQQVDKLDYTLVDEHQVDDLEIKVKRTLGGTPDRAVNAWHRDFYNLSASKLLQLAEVILPEEDKRDRISRKTLEQRIRDAVTTGHIDKGKLNETMANNLGHELGGAGANTQS